MSELNARIGRTLPNPMFGALVTLAPGTASRTSPELASRVWHWRNLPLHGVRRIEAIPLAWRLLALLLAALWPHWVWMARRLTDGSDEPWGILALATVLALVARERARVAPPGRTALLFSAVLAVFAALAHWALPPLPAAAAAVLALAIFLAAALPHRPAAPLATLLLLALPVIASLQFYLGYPLRWLTAQAAAPLLVLVGIDATARGAALAWDGRSVLVDPPCAGIGMLWVGSYVAALLSYLNAASARRTLVNGVVAAVLVFVANVLRNTLLFFPEAGLVHWPEWMHRIVGLAAFALAILPLVLFTHASARARRP